MRPDCNRALRKENRKLRLLLLIREIEAGEKEKITQAQMAEELGVTERYARELILERIGKKAGIKVSPHLLPTPPEPSGLNPVAPLPSFRRSWDIPPRARLSCISIWLGVM